MKFDYLEEVQDYVWKEYGEYFDEEELEEALEYNFLFGDDIEAEIFYDEDLEYYVLEV